MLEVSISARMFVSAARRLFHVAVLLGLMQGLIPNSLAETTHGRRYNDPWDRMAQWKSGNVDGTSCPSISNRLAQTLSKTESCAEWGKLWVSDMKCAVENELTVSKIAYCWKFNKDVSGLRSFYRMLASQHGDRICSDSHVEGPVNCRDFAASSPNALEDYSLLPTDPNKLVAKVFDAMKRRDFKKIAKYFHNDIVYFGGDATYETVDAKLLKSIYPKRFSELFVGVPESDSLYPRRESDPVYPCIGSGPWGKQGEHGELSFQVMDKPLRINEPRRYSLMILHGGCKRVR